MYCASAKGDSACTPSDGPLCPVRVRAIGQATRKRKTRARGARRSILDGGLLLHDGRLLCRQHLPRHLLPLQLLLVRERLWRQYCAAAAAARVRARNTLRLSTRPQLRALEEAIAQHVLVGRCGVGKRRKVGKLPLRQTKAASRAMMQASKNGQSARRNSICAHRGDRSMKNALFARTTPVMIS